MANEVIGTCICYGRGCSEITSVHVTKRGGVDRKGLLYLNCPECKCLQPKGATAQKYIKSNLVPREGFEHWSEKEPEKSEKEPEKEAVKEPEEAKPKTVKEPVNKAPLAVLSVFVLGALAFLS